VKKQISAGLCGLLLCCLWLAPASAYETWTWEQVGKIPRLAMDSQDYGGVLILSDNPETVEASGIMYQDYVEGAARLFMHHVNGGSSPCLIAAVLQNDGNEPAVVAVDKSTLVGPGFNYSLIGKQVCQQYFEANDFYKITVPAHGSAVLDPRMLAKIVNRNQLITGMYDFTTDKKLLVKTVMTSYGANVLKYAAKAPILPMETEHPRGTFKTCNRMLFLNDEYVPEQDGRRAIFLADNINDHFLTGIDGITGKPALNFGNYGVVYQLLLVNANNQPYRLEINPRGGTYGGALGLRNRLGMTRWKVVLTPREQTVFGQNTVCHVEQVTDLDGAIVNQLLFTPPAASNLPIHLILEPLQK
jgi:hypothetical protein